MQRVSVSSGSSWRWFETMQVGKMGLSSVPGLAIYHFQESLGLCPALRFKRGGGTTLVVEMSRGHIRLQLKVVAIPGTLATSCGFRFGVAFCSVAFQFAVWITLLCAEDYCSHVDSGSILDQEFCPFACSSVQAFLLCIVIDIAYSYESTLIFFPSVFRVQHWALQLNE